MGNNLILVIILACLYSITLSLSKGVQKWGIEGLTPTVLKQWQTKPELKKKFIAWTIGSIGTMIAVLFSIAAQPLSPNSSFIAAFSGVGLLALVIFSYYVLHEPLRLIEIIGTIIVVVSTIFFGIVADDTFATSIDYVALAYLAGIPILVMFLFAWWSAKRNYFGHAFIWGTIAGFFAGLGMFLTQTAAISSERNFWAMLLTVNFLFAIITSQGAFWGTQYGFKHGQATVVVTLYNTLMLAVPVLGDLFVLKQQIPPMQLFALLGIGIGVVCLTAFRPIPQTKQPDESKQANKEQKDP